MKRRFPLVATPIAFAALFVPRLLVATAFAAAPAAAPASPASKETAFDNPKFSFSFTFDPAWIPSIQGEGESITFALSEGEVFISAQRDPNPKHLKTRQELADDQIASWKRREGLVFSKLDRTETTLGNLPATKIDGTAKEYDEDFPYKLEQYVVEKDGRLFVVKYSGLYDPSLPYWEGFQRVIRSFKFRGTGDATASVTPVRTAAPKGTPRATPAATPTAAPTSAAPEATAPPAGDAIPD